MLPVCIQWVTTKLNEAEIKVNMFKECEFLCFSSHFI